ncbi:MAG: hypothetical protein ACOCV1_04240 [Bacillota bacterium]
MSKINDLDITGIVEARSGNILGDAHEHFVVAIMMRLGLEVAITELSAGPYDCLVFAYTAPPTECSNPPKELLTVQVKTASNSVPLTGGSRAGVDRVYNTEETQSKTYKYTSDIVDLIMGVDRETLDIYIIPALYVEFWGSSKALSKLQPLKNNWDILLNWNHDYLEELRLTLPDFK